jgi:branched-chain amino acid transport system substrate-binding protein
MITKNRFTSTLVVLSATLAVSSFTSCTKKSTEGSAQNAAATASTIKVGEVGSMTGSEATFGTSTHKGIELALKQINAAGGVNGKQIELITVDNQSKADETALATTKLITQDKVTAILGEVASSRSLIMAPIAQQNKVPMISPSSTNPKVTEVGDYIFRVCFIDPFQGEVMARFAIENLKVKKVAILKDVKSDYSMGLSQFFIDTLKKSGGEVVIEQSYSSGDLDFKSQLTAVKAKNPEAIFVPGYYTEVGLISRQARELGIKAPLLGGDGWDSPKLTEIGGKSIEGSYFSNHYSPEDQNPRVVNFVKDFKTAYNEVPDGLAAMGYDAMIVLAEALKKTPDLDGVKLRDAIAATKDHPGVTGTISLNSQRNPVKSSVVLKVEGNQMHYMATIQPK